jgi:hypothetical protein
MVFTHTYSWITEGLEDQVGRKFGDKVVGYEYDTFFEDRSPAKAVRLFQTPFNDVEGCPQTQCASYYERQSAFDQFGVGGGIFSAGSIQWSWGLEESEIGTQPDPRMQLLTSNLLKGLSQILRAKQYGMTVVRAQVTGPYAIPHMPIFLEPVHVGPDTTSLGTFAMMDDGQYPDLVEGDGIYATQFPLYRTSGCRSSSSGRRRARRRSPRCGSRTTGCGSRTWRTTGKPSSTRAASTRSTSTTT